MKRMGTARKLAVAVAVCMAVLCLPGYSEPTPEQIAERTEMLLQAIKDNNVERAKICIKSGVDVNAKDSEGISALTYAILYGKTDIADLLRSAGATE